MHMLTWVKDMVSEDETQYYVEVLKDFWIRHADADHM